MSMIRGRAIVPDRLAAGEGRGSGVDGVRETKAQRYRDAEGYFGERLWVTR
jgi:hypothetical protein